MGAPKIRRDVIKHERRTRQLSKSGRVSTIAVAVDASGKILGAGIHHTAVAEKLGAVNGGYEILEFPLWR